MGPLGRSQHPHKRKRKISLAFSPCTHAPRRGRREKAASCNASPGPAWMGTLILDLQTPEVWKYLLPQPEQADTGSTEKSQTHICVDSTTD